MPDLTVTIPTPATQRAKAAIAKFGPQLVGDKFPKDGEGNPKTNLSDAEAVAVGEAMLRRFLRDMVKQHEAEEAVENARQNALNKVENDGVIPEPA